MYMKINETRGHELTRSVYDPTSKVSIDLRLDRDDTAVANRDILPAINTLTWVYDTSADDE